MRYQKLVRDKIPELLKDMGKAPRTHIAGDSEYWQKLKEKLSEEAGEFLEDESEEELADIMEVVLAICKVKGIEKKTLEMMRSKKAKERGSFDKKIILEEA